MKNDDIKDVIKDLNTYHEEKERKYFERNLLKQKLGKIIFVLVIILVILGFILYLILAPEEKIETVFHITNLISSFLV
jgi:uncharacterized BrkB/YihY/UPF0761 family membrane protein